MKGIVITTEIEVRIYYLYLLLKVKYSRYVQHYGLNSTTKLQESITQRSPFVQIHKNYAYI